MMITDDGKCHITVSYQQAAYVCVCVSVYGCVYSNVMHIFIHYLSMKSRVIQLLQELYSRGLKAY